MEKERKKSVGLSARFQSLQESSPFVVNSIMAALIAAAGSVLEQVVLRDGFNDIAVVQKQVTLAFLLTPISTFWYTNCVSGMAKMSALVADQGAFQPVYMLIWWIVKDYYDSSQINDLSQVYKFEFQGEFWQALRLGYYFWLPIAVVRTYTIKPQMQVLFNCLAGVAWTMIIQFLKLV